MDLETQSIPESIISDDEVTAKLELHKIRDNGQLKTDVLELDLPLFWSKIESNFLISSSEHYPISFNRQPCFPVMVRSK